MRRIHVQDKHRIMHVLRGTVAMVDLLNELICVYSRCCVHTSLVNSDVDDDDDRRPHVANKYIY